MEFGSHRTCQCGGWERVNILLVDDDADIVDTLAAQLTISALEANVEGASSGERALELLSESGKSFDLVISDVSLGEMDGYQLLMAMREQGFSHPVILMSGDLSVKASKEINSYTECAFIEKPWNMNDVVEKINNCISAK
jgi:DNA-binding NtrC family response regulator